MGKGIARGWVVLLVLFAVGIPALAQSQPEQTGADDIFYGWSPDSRQVLLVSYRDGSAEIYVAKTDGSALQDISNSPADDTNPVWSPDGKHIAFVSDRDGSLDIYVTDLSGSAPVNLTHNPANDHNPQWSPDSRQLVFFSDRGGNDQLYVMGADGSAPHSIAPVLKNISDVVWSPDGQWIGFDVSDPSDDQPMLLDIVHPDGSGLRNLLDSYWFFRVRCCDVEWRWSRDSQTVLFSVSGDGTIYTVNIQTGALRPVAYAGGSVGWLDWHEDSQHLYVRLYPDSEAVEAGRTGDYRVNLADGSLQSLGSNFVEMAPDEAHSTVILGVLPKCCLTITAGKTDGTGKQAVVRNIYNAIGNLSWSPDSQWVAGTLCVDGDADVYLLNAEHGQAVNLTADDAFSTSPGKPTLCAGFG